MHKGAGILTSKTVDELYQCFITHWFDSSSVIIDGQLPTTLVNGLPNLKSLNDIQRMMAQDIMTYLPDDILVKVDRAAMGVSLETRVPFLDHRVVEFARCVLQSMKLRNGQSKWARRQVFTVMSLKS